MDILEKAKAVSYDSSRQASIEITEEMAEEGVSYLAKEYRYSGRLLADASAFDVARLVAIDLGAGDKLVELQDVGLED